jgi:hypothetical protein
VGRQKPETDASPRNIRPHPAGRNLACLDMPFIQIGSGNMIRFAATLALALLAVSTAPAADDAEKTRVGTCRDARSQMEYFCNPDNAASDSMVALGTACNNAKNNVKEACEGIVEPDPEYKFDDAQK